VLSKGLLVGERYELDRLIGYGGMGEVWGARDKTLDRPVAAKFVHPHLIASDPAALKILEDEAKFGAQLIGHPNIVLTLDYVTFNHIGSKFHCIVMENVPGVSLQSWISQFGAKLDSETYTNISLLIAMRIGQAIQFAHNKGLQHRDIKPMNVFLSIHGNIKVGDFGIAKYVEEVTRTHTVWGAMSPAYAAPEQWAGEKPTVETDIYQLGCTLYQLLVKKLPYEGTHLGLMNQHVHSPVPKVAELNEAIPKGLSEVIALAMSKAPGARPSLWQIHDQLSMAITHKFQLDLDGSKCTEEVKKRVYEITEFEEATIDNGSRRYTYEDFDEALSEGLALVLSGVEIIRLTRPTTSRLILKKNAP
jgi:serine/threonine protein kinase